MTETRIHPTALTKAALARRAAFRPVLVVLTGFLVVSIAMEAVLIVQSVSGTEIDPAVWVRCSIVLGSSILLLVFAATASRGSRPAWRRLRIIAPIVVVAVIVIVAIPGFLPDWVRVEQAVCGALVLPAAILVNLPGMSILFPKEA
ncbi:hypothetical protein ACFVWR_00150 [Leifsonia sp. NPDC058292]|uniref:hypothetical protein n=1 Tax=Leifsonia sp. NPDC058292 TaxID=3346428 RepID=UPI0036D793D5